MLVPSVALWILNKLFDTVGYTLVYILFVFLESDEKISITLTVCLCANNEARASRNVA